MKTLIIYSSKTGITKKCAALLAANIGADSCDLFEINFFADIINIKILKRNHLCLGWALNPMTIILRQKRTNRKRRLCEDGGKD